MVNPLRKKYGSFFAESLRSRRETGSPIVRLRQDKVPEELWPLIPYAEFWGISDDGDRIELILSAPATAWKDFLATVAGHQSALSEWLAGPESYSETPTEEYIAFSSMWMASDWPRE